MKNKELIEKILKKVKGDNLQLKKTIEINLGDDERIVMTEIVNDDNEWCLATGKVNWVVPLKELTNKELLYLRKCI
jgi:hypothetical protein